MENTINEDRKWKVLESEYLIRRPWLTARRDRAELPDGRINNEYYVLEYPDWVNIIAVTEDGDIVLERQYRHGLGNTCYELPCGVIEKGETPLEAAKRELLEETGYAGGQWQEWMIQQSGAQFSGVRRKEGGGPKSGCNGGYRGVSQKTGICARTAGEQPDPSGAYGSSPVEIFLW